MLALVCFGVGLSAIAALLSNGCAGEPESYPATYQFSPRHDPIVVELPKIIPTEREPNGELDEGIRRIPSRGGKIVEPDSTPSHIRDELNSYLAATFGTPAAPTISVDGEIRALADQLGLTDERLAKGSALFRARCQECHGPNGDGRGPTAAWLTPNPRDFRQGAFKFASTNGSGPRKPSRSDLFRTLTNGLLTTPMPSFGLRSEEDRHRLIDYVMFLALRGRTEFEVLKTVLVHGEDDLDGTVSEHATGVLKREFRAWLKAQDDEMPADVPELADGSPEQTESIRRGHALFLDPKTAGCVTCHIDHGRDGKLQYDTWGTVVRPANLTEVKRKAGNDPATLFRRIRGGVGPSNMPAVIGLSDAQAWDVVQFLRALPYPDRLPEDVKAKVYGGR